VSRQAGRRGGEVPWQWQVLRQNLNHMRQASQVEAGIVRMSRCYGRRQVAEEASVHADAGKQCGMAGGSSRRRSVTSRRSRHPRRHVQEAQAPQRTQAVSHGAAAVPMDRRQSQAAWQAAA